MSQRERLLFSVLHDYASRQSESIERFLAVEGFNHDFVRGACYAYGDLARMIQTLDRITVEIDTEDS